MDTYIVMVAIPAYNEGDSLAPLIRKLDRLKETAQTNLQVVFVNDGSRDNTGAVLAQAAAARPYITVLTHPQNQGLGAAINTILAYACDHLSDADVLVTMDGDNTHDPAAIPPMVNKLKRERLDLVIASRFVRGGAERGLPPYRKLLSRGASLFFRLFFRIPHVRDYSSGYRAYHMAFLRGALARWGALVTADGFECMAEILAKFSRLKPRAGEYPLVLRYDQKQSPSKMRIMRTIRGYFNLLRKAG